jgi:hypothetical protein
MNDTGQLGVSVQTTDDASSGNIQLEQRKRQKEGKQYCEAVERESQKDHA